MPNIHHAIWIAASASNVYDALTIQQGLAAWWTPHAMAEDHVGAVLKFPFGGSYFKEMKIVTLQHNEYVEWLCTTGAEEWIGTTISFHLQPGTKDDILKSHPEIADQVQQSLLETGTLLLFHHDNWRDYTLMYAECNYTWGRFLRCLKLYCETGNGTPWPKQHQL